MGQSDDLELGKVGSEHDRSRPGYIVQLLIYGVITPKSCPVAFGRNGALRDQKSRGRLPEHSVQGLEIVPIREFHELAELRLDRVQSLRIQRLLIPGWRSGHGACGKCRQSEGGREKHLLHDHYPSRMVNGRRAVRREAERRLVRLIVR